MILLKMIIIINKTIKFLNYLMKKMTKMKFTKIQSNKKIVIKKLTFYKFLQVKQKNKKKTI